VFSFFRYSLLIISFFCLPLIAQEPVPPFRPELVEVKDVKGLPRVLLIGDSVSIGYTLEVRKQLKGIANVHRPPVNCKSTDISLKNIEAWLGKGSWDVIHFNWGLHDMISDHLGEKSDKPELRLAEYKRNLRTLVIRLKKTNAKLIWRNTTPVLAGAKNRQPSDPILYNKIASEIMSEFQIPTQDLYTFAQANANRVILPKDVHFTLQGYKELADRVTLIIKEALKNKLTTNDVFELKSTKQPSTIMMFGHFYPLLYSYKKADDEKLSSEYIGALTKQISQIKNLKGIIIGGDFFWHNSKEEHSFLLKNFFGKLKVPVFYIPANHEFKNFKNVQETSKLAPFNISRNQIINDNNKTYILFSAWKSKDNDQLDSTDIAFLKDALTNKKSTKKEDNVLILADARVFVKPIWKREIQPLVDKNIGNVIIGDNEATKHHYQWMKKRDVNYIFQGMSYDTGLGGHTSFLTFTNNPNKDLEFQVQFLKIDNALDEIYQVKEENFKF